MLELKRVRVFREVARLRSFSAAADALNYSQPAVSHHVSRLELEIGAQLLIRNPRGGISLTEAGQVLLSHADGMLDRVIDAETELAQIVRTEGSRVRLGAFTTASATIVAEAAGRLRRAAPGVSLTLVEGETPETLERLRERKIDLGVIFDDPLHPASPDPEVEVRYMFDDPLLVALPRRHPLARERAVQLADLRDADWIEGAGRETPCSLILVDAFEEAGYEPRIAFHSGDYQVVLRLVAAGVGVGLVPQLAIAGVHSDIVLRPVRPRSLVRRVAVASRSGGYRPPGVTQMLEELERSCERLLASRAPLTDQPAGVRASVGAR